MPTPPPGSPLDQLLSSGKKKQAEEHHSRPFWKVVLDFLNPGYHVKRFKEDLLVTRAALEKRKHLISGEVLTEDMPEIFRGKLFGVFFLTGWTNLVGIGLGYVAQKMFSSEWVGLFATPVLCYFVTAVGFQIGWWLDNRRIYAAYHPDPAHRFWELQKDMFPVHKASLPMAVVFAFANLIVATPILALISWLSPEISREIPAGLLIMIGEFLFIGGSFVRIMGDFFDKYSYHLAMKYRNVCTQNQVPRPDPTTGDQ